MIGRFFSTTLGQILAIIAISSLVTFLIFIAHLSLFYPGAPPPPPWPWQPAYRIANLIDSLQAVPGDGRTAIMEAFKQLGMPSIRLTQAPALCGKLSADTRELEAVLKAELGASVDSVAVRSCNPEDPATGIQVLVGLGDQTLDVRLDNISSAPPRISFPFMASVLFLCVAVAAMSAWAVWRVIRPLRRLSEKADAFGQNISISRIEEEGPLEIRCAARAFNRMQQRVTRSIQDRTRTLAAISHDLRTPLTRMRLLLETRATGEVRDKLLRDVGLMQSMVSSALAFLSGSFDEEEGEWLDLGALLSTLCDEYEERGANVRYRGPEQIRFFCRPNAINRAMVNLVDNGVHFGKSVLITASAESDGITIDVADDGPGIPRDRIQDVLEPFVRLDPSRSTRPGSVGLGLSIVKDIVEHHGGKLELVNKRPTGLIARLKFPKPSSHQ